MEKINDIKIKLIEFLNNELSYLSQTEGLEESLYQSLLQDLELNTLSGSDKVKLLEVIRKSKSTRITNMLSIIKEALIPPKMSYNMNINTSIESTKNLQEQEEEILRKLSELVRYTPLQIEKKAEEGTNGKK